MLVASNNGNSIDNNSSSANNNNNTAIAAKSHGKAVANAKQTSRASIDFAGLLAHFDETQRKHQVVIVVVVV